MSEALAEAFESELPKEDIKPKSLPDEITKTPGPDFKPPWKHESEPHLSREQIPDNKLPWKVEEMPRDVQLDISKPQWKDEDELIPKINPVESLRERNTQTIKEAYEKESRESMLPNNTSPFKVESEPQVKQIHTRNETLEGQTHPETGVPFVRKIVMDAYGNLIEGVFPEFPSLLDVQLPEDLYQASDAEQEKECNKQLKNAVENDPELAKKFIPEQLEQIKNGDTPDGYTWHHNEDTGKMQLVDSETHAKTGHTGGKVIWGGGQENR